MSYLCYLPMRRIALSTFRKSSAQTRRQYRQFSTTITRRADEKPKPDMMAVIQELKETKLFQEIGRNKELMVSIKEVVEVLEEEGFDRNESSKTMLLTNPRIREKMTKLVSAVQAAGIDPATAKEAFELVKSRLMSE